MVEERKMEERQTEEGHNLSAPRGGEGGKEAESAIARIM